MNITRNIQLIALSVLMFSSVTARELRSGDMVTLSREALFDKVKGGWAGQMVGVAYGGPTEFQYNGTIIQDYIPLNWHDNSIGWYYDNFPGLFDDVYMDVTFVHIIDKYGVNAPIDSFATAFAKADYLLWHANQAARYNILNGIAPPQSGHWRNNPHADDIDYQIEADYAGIMSPGMANSASEISDRVGHIMNYGDGWYGGVYVGAMYTQAFVSDDIAWIVEESLKSIPQQSKFHQCISSAIASWKRYPNDWKQAWFELERDWSSDLYCPDGVFVPFNIDATINAAYVVLGLLYGEGDFTKTMDIATRCGQDSDCNPATAAGILGVVHGYSAIPQQYMTALRRVEDRELIHTGMTLNQLYNMSFRHALTMVSANGGKVGTKNVELCYQTVEPVRLEVSFEGHYPNKKETIQKRLDTVESYSFEGNGIIVRGKVDGPAGYAARVEFYVDDTLVETSLMPANYNTRKNEIFWRYDLSPGSHTLSFKWLNPQKDAQIHLWDAIWYGPQPLDAQRKKYD